MKLTLENDWNQGTEIHLDEETKINSDLDPPCRHATKVRVEKCPDSQAFYTTWKIPKVVVAVNQGGHDSTSVCLDCANELLVSHLFQDFPIEV